ncbi:cobalt-precorrin-7 (C(5))-methyltransferase [Vagococcus intermedius]|uniref:Cobalt-precorrin-7 (C(5))-methyltransferase n=1 Tax=Vagococcus intermedius TaxID=2991418 RepID=A0AAF0CTM5_9ENTE|nr:cobalt-precorrin-7 (C(5))-methyltransferase [Vagococcus intermedius]WEG72740.1 cobalt-precorrin-7 (C(5))-methyltransferase [Vagococcus intermedius]WEG74826.1 cobalt-precorrin-7 (C(5))-methyltransferase [Vagococcus intermedius]
MITIVGIGPGRPELILNAGLQAIEAADLIIGSTRQLASFPQVSEENKCELPKKLLALKDILLENKTKKCVVLASGNPMLYGIGNWLSAQFEEDEVVIISGISAIQYLFAKMKLSQNDCYLTSSHGKVPDLELIFSLPKVAMVTDDSCGPYQLAQASLVSGKSKRFLIGENLSYPNERIMWYEASEVPDRKYELNVVVIIDA